MQVPTESVIYKGGGRVEKKMYIGTSKVLPNLVVQVNGMFLAMSPFT